MYASGAVCVCRQEGRRQASMYRPVMSRTHTVDVPSPSSSPHRLSSPRRQASHADHPHSRHTEQLQQQLQQEFSHSVQLPATSSL